MKAVSSYSKKFFSFFPLSYILVTLFFIAYAVLGLVRHAHYGSFGADLGFTDHFIWSLRHWTFADIPGSFTGHFDIIFLLIAWLYNLYADVNFLIILQALIVTSSGIPIFQFARKRGLIPVLSYAVLLSYLLFYGIQNALWFDVHSSALGAAFLAWFIYFLDSNRVKLSLLAFVLTVISKENMAAYVFLVTLVHFIGTRNRLSLVYCGLSVVYLFMVFYIYFPSIRTTGYAYSSSQGLLSGTPWQMIDTDKKRTTLFYTFAWVGFIPLLLPLYILPVLGNLASYFILGREYVAAHEIFMHYRIDLAPLLFFATVLTLARYKFLNNRYVAVYLLLCAVVLQYVLHLPLSYLAKGWFWHEPSSVPGIEKIIAAIPANSSVVAQNNIYPHVSEREHIELLWPDKRTFPLTASPCRATNCPWFRWGEYKYQYLIVDLSPEWDIRHLLQNNDEFRQAVEGMEKTGVIKLVRQEGTARLYSVEKAPK